MPEIKTQIVQIAFLVQHTAILQSSSQATGRYLSFRKRLAADQLIEAKLLDTFICAHSQAIYMIDKLSGTITDMRQSVNTGRVVVLKLQEYTKRTGIIESNKPFFYLAENARGNTRPITEIVVVEDNVHQTMIEGFGPDENLPQFSVVDEFDQAIAKLGN